MQTPEPLPEPALPFLRELQALCPMRFQQLQMGPHALKIWTASDLDPLLNALVEKDAGHPDLQDERMPYWAELWPSSILMAEALVVHQSELPEGRWLELGCGPGLPGILAAKFGRAGVCSDYMSEALSLAKLNAYQNECADLVACVELDWRTPTLKERFSWIMAGDVAYEKRNFEPLAESFDRLLAPGGEIWLGEPGRSVARPFFDLLESLGWQWSCLKQRKDVCIHRIQRGP